MAQQTNGYLKLYTYKATDTDVTFRDFREEIAGLAVGNIESNFEKLDDIYTQQINNEIITLSLSSDSTGVYNGFGGKWDCRTVFQNNTVITVQFPDTFPEEDNYLGELIIAYNKISDGARANVIGTLGYIDRDGNIQKAQLSDIQKKGIYTLVFKSTTDDENTYFIIKSLKNGVDSLVGIPTNNIVAKATDHTFKDTGIAYTSVLTKPSLEDYTDNTLVVKNTVEGSAIVQGTTIAQSNVCLCDGTRPITLPKAMQGLTILSQDDNNSLALKWANDENSLLGYVGDLGIGEEGVDTPFISISKTNNCVDKLIYKSTIEDKSGDSSPVSGFNYATFRAYAVPGGAIFDIRWSSGTTTLSIPTGTVVGRFSTVKLAENFTSWGYVCRTNNNVWETAQVQINLTTSGTITVTGTPFSCRRMSLFTFVPQEYLV